VALKERDRQRDASEDDRLLLAGRGALTGDLDAQGGLGPGVALRGSRLGLRFRSCRLQRAQAWLMAASNLGERRGPWRIPLLVELTGGSGRVGGGISGQRPQAEPGGEVVLRGRDACDASLTQLAFRQADGER